MTAKTLFTIGYEDAKPESLVATLRDAGVKVVIDVRAVAASRRPGFSKRLLAAAVTEAGMRYEHMRDLGTPKAGREAARRGNVGEMHRIFRHHMETPEAQTALAAAIATAEAAPVCLLCLERDHNHCHRSIVADMMAERSGFTIMPLVG